ncbi:hypothetical protein P153DRAFT_380931 [Dothidotthia symphoricarpi CBS 119687]|uniref:Uncharacterized protein n=1 Tax=Dothidotthia symphoricarpi CBS 119687 TaxID=1392245 RepID=A0A6A6ASC4_9PLEO|nr:uncharacterized protein P153DRAFT_380931 [Dothidotthia symphoricarpi CBS 119687]KAF2133747.1 hypothetical protein P153DRAFT_380931 [Dothidotthia symphoricarpi CBS 119687]
MLSASDHPIDDPHLNQDALPANNPCISPLVHASDKYSAGTLGGQLGGLFGGDMPEPKALPEWPLEEVGYIYQPLYVSPDGRISGGAYSPEYYIYESDQVCAWDEGLQAIEDFDWPTGKQHRGDLCGASDGDVEVDATEDDTAETSEDLEDLHSAAEVVVSEVNPDRALVEAASSPPWIPDLPFDVAREEDIEITAEANESIPSPVRYRSPSPQAAPTVTEVEVHNDKDADAMDVDDAISTDTNLEPLVLPESTPPESDSTIVEPETQHGDNMDVTDVETKSPEAITIDIELATPESTPESLPVHEPENTQPTEERPQSPIPAKHINTTETNQSEITDKADFTANLSPETTLAPPTLNRPTQTSKWYGIISSYIPSLGVPSLRRTSQTPRAEEEHEVNAPAEPEDVDVPDFSVADADSPIQQDEVQRAELAIGKQYSASPHNMTPQSRGSEDTSSTVVESEVPHTTNTLAGSSVPPSPTPIEVLENENQPWKTQLNAAAADSSTDINPASPPEPEEEPNPPSPLGASSPWAGSLLEQHLERVTEQSSSLFTAYEADALPAAFVSKEEDIMLESLTPCPVVLQTQGKDTPLSHGDGNPDGDERVVSAPQTQTQIQTQKQDIPKPPLLSTPSPTPGLLNKRKRKRKHPTNDADLDTVAPRRKRVKMTHTATIPITEVAHKDDAHRSTHLDVIVHDYDQDDEDVYGGGGEQEDELEHYSDVSPPPPSIPPSIPLPPSIPPPPPPPLKPKLVPKHRVGGRELAGLTDGLSRGSMVGGRRGRVKVQADTRLGLGESGADTMVREMDGKMKMKKIDIEGGDAVMVEVEVEVKGKEKEKANKYGFKPSPKRLRSGKKKGEMGGGKGGVKGKGKVGKVGKGEIDGPRQTRSGGGGRM